MSESQWIDDPNNRAALDRMRREFSDACAAVDVRNVFTGRPNLEASDTQTPATLIGYGAFSLGELWQLRYNDPVAGPALNRLERRIAGTVPRIVPPIDATPAEEMQAHALDAWLQSMAGGPGAFIGKALVDVFSFGRYAAEVRVEVSHRGQRLSMFQIAQPSLRFNATPDGSRLTGVSQSVAVSGGSGGDVPAWKLFFIHNPRAPGDFEGYAELTRPLLAYKLLREMIVKSDLAYRQVARGMPVFRETTPEATVAGQSASVSEWVGRWMRGEPSPMYVPYGLEEGWFNPPATAADIIPTLRYIDEQMRRTLMDSLSSLGVSATGSRALGEEFSHSDSADFADLISAYIVQLNGSSERYSDLVDILARTLQIPLRGRWPHLVLEGLSSIPVSQQIAQIRAAKDAGIDLEVSRKDVSRIREEIGIGPLRDPDANEWTEDVERIDRDLAALRSAELGELTRAQARAVLIRNGWDEAAADELLEAPMPATLHATAERYSEIDRSVTPAMQDAVRRGLAFRRRYGRGMQERGLTTARAIARGGDLSIDQWRTMRAWFARHRGNRDPDAREPDGGPKAGWIAWLGWGGDAAASRAESIMRQVETADGVNASSSCGCKACRGERRLDARVDNTRNLSDYEAMEAYLDRAEARATRLVQEASRAHRAAFLAEFDGADALTLASAQVDYTDVYAAALRVVAGEARVRARREMLRDLVNGGHLPPPDYQPDEETDTAIEAAILLRAREFSDTANDQLRTAALAIEEDGALPSTEERWVMPVTTAALVAGSGIVYAFMREQQDLLVTAQAFASSRLSARVSVTATREVLQDGTVLTRNEDGSWTETRPAQPSQPDVPGAPTPPRVVRHAAHPVGVLYARYRAIMDGAVCEECEAMDGTVLRVGSASYMAVRPPNPRCHSARNLVRGNRCRCHLELLPSGYTPSAADRVLGDDDEEDA
jgi:hypothetical protein